MSITLKHYHSTRFLVIVIHFLFEQPNFTFIEILLLWFGKTIRALLMINHLFCNDILMYLYYFIMKTRHNFIKNQFTPICVFFSMQILHAFVSTLSKVREQSWWRKDWGTKSKCAYQTTTSSLSTFIARIKWNMVIYGNYHELELVFNRI